MMRGVLEFFSMFDWISPTIGLIEDIANDPTFLQKNSWTFFVPFDEMLENGWSAWNVERLMNEHNIKHWGGMITNGEFYFTVKLERAQWAEYILLKNNIPLTGLSQGPPQKENTYHEK